MDRNYREPQTMAEIKSRQTDCRRRAKQVALRVIMALILLAAMAAAVLLSSCSLDDDRDICCEEVVLLYRYIRQDQDEYKQFVHEMRHFLFDADGIFIREEFSTPENPQIVRLPKLEEGRYTMITVGNASSKNTRLNELVAGGSDLRKFHLELANKDTNGFHANGDELFWNERSFVAEPMARHRYICDLSNIHCHLFVRVLWEVLPPHDGTYTMRLSEVATENSLDPAEAATIIIRQDSTQGTESTKQRVVHTFPKLTGRFGEHIIDVPLYNLELRGEFITLRYTNNHIPVFRLYFNDELINNKVIDLTKAFRSWGWRPDEHPEQIYRIQLEYLANGKVVVSQWADANVMDWQDGGIFGN